MVKNPCPTDGLVLPAWRHHRSSNGALKVANLGDSDAWGQFIKARFQPAAETNDAHNTGDRVSFEGADYESVIDGGRRARIRQAERGCDCLVIYRERVL